MAYPLRTQPSKPGAPQHRNDQPHRDDTGLTLIEVIVAMALFLVLITSSMSVLLVALKTTAVNRDRVGAANLAGRELEIIRDQFNSATRGPATISLAETINDNPLIGAVAGSDVILDNVHYTVTRNARWVAIGDESAVASKCDEGTKDELDYLHINVSVSWSRMAGNPISMDTFLTPPKGTHPDARGQIGVKLRDAAGKPVVGPVLTIVGPVPSTGTITSLGADHDGCTVITDLLPGSYTVTVNEPNYVSHAGTQAATLTANVLPGAMWRGGFDYDLSARVLVTFAALVTPPATPPTTYNVPTDQDIPVSFGNEGLPLGTMSKLRPADLTQPITGLWPFLSGYQLWAGNCVDADPKLDRTPAVGVQPDFTTVAQVDLAPIHVTGAPDGSIVKAVHVSALPDGSDTSCPGGDTITLGVITGGQLNTSAPYGEWKLTAGTLSVPIAQVSDPFTLVSGDPPKDAVLR